MPPPKQMHPQRPWLSVATPPANGSEPDVNTATLSPSGAVSPSPAVGSQGAFSLSVPCAPTAGPWPPSQSLHSRLSLPLWGSPVPGPVGASGGARVQGKVAVFFRGEDERGAGLWFGLDFKWGLFNWTNFIAFSQ